MSKPTGDKFWKKSASSSSISTELRSESVTESCKKPNKCLVTASFSCCSVNGCITDWDIQKCVITPPPLNTCVSEFSPCIVPGIGLEADFKVTVTNSVSRKVCYVTSLNLSASHGGKKEDGESSGDDEEAAKAAKETSKTSETIKASETCKKPENKDKHRSCFLRKLKVGVYRNNHLIDVQRLKDIEVLSGHNKELVISNCITLETAPLPSDVFTFKVINFACDDKIDFESTTCATSITTCNPNDKVYLSDSAKTLTAPSTALPVVITAVKDLEGNPAEDFQTYVTVPPSYQVVPIRCSDAPLVFFYRVTVPAPDSETVCVGKFVNTARLFDEPPTSTSVPIAQASVPVSPICAKPSLNDCALEITNDEPCKWKLTKTVNAGDSINGVCVRSLGDWLDLGTFFWPISEFTNCNIPAAEIADFLQGGSGDDCFRTALGQWVAALLNITTLEPCDVIAPSNVTGAVISLGGAINGVLSATNPPCDLDSAVLDCGGQINSSILTLTEFNTGNEGVQPCVAGLPPGVCFGQALDYQIQVTRPALADFRVCFSALFSLEGCLQIPNIFALQFQACSALGCDDIIPIESGIGPGLISTCFSGAQLGLDAGTFLVNLLYSRGTLNVSTQDFTASSPEAFITASTCSIPFDFDINATLCDIPQDDCDTQESPILIIPDTATPEERAIIEAMFSESCAELGPTDFPPSGTLVLEFSLVYNSDCDQVINNIATLTSADQCSTASASIPLPPIDAVRGGVLKQKDQKVITKGPTAPALGAKPTAPVISSNSATSALGASSAALGASSAALGAKPAPVISSNSAAPALGAKPATPALGASPAPAKGCKTCGKKKEIKK